MADLSQIPLGVNPNGDPPDFVHGESLKSVILGTGITLIALSSAFVAIRLGTSLKSSRKLLLDDCRCECAHEARFVGFFQALTTVNLCRRRTIG